MTTKPRTEMTPEELAKQEEQEFNTGPLSVLTQSVKNNTQVRFLTPANSFAGVYGPGWITFPSVSVSVCLSVCASLSFFDPHPHSRLCAFFSV